MFYYNVYAVKYILQSLGLCQFVYNILIKTFVTLQ